MTDNTTLPGVGIPVESKDVGGGIQRQIVAIGDWALTENDPIGATNDSAPASDTAAASLNGRLQRIAQRISTLIGTTLAISVGDGQNVTLGARTDNKSAATDGTSVSAMSIWKQISATLQARVNNANGQAAMANSQPVVLASDQSWSKGLSPKAFVSTFNTMTRPANTTAYSAGDSISNNATPASVTPMFAIVSDTNDDPVSITDIVLSSTDTGLAGKRVRVNVFNADPTAGVVAGDNAAYSQRIAGYVGSFQGWMENGFADGTVGRLVPMFGDTNNTPAGQAMVVKPVTGDKTIFIQLIAVDAFTPSANSTTFTARARGFQGRAN